jgi:glyoxylase-like metal-dependent hydrolase (beta-lactamase superfamily II)
MQSAIDITRRSFLVHAGRGTIALAVLGIAGCGPSAIGSAATSSSPASAAPTGSSGSGEPSATSAGGSSSVPPSSAAGGVTWERANLGFVSAYVLARAGEAAIVDTGEAGSEGTISEALEAIGLGWDAVGQVILTHRHGDHIGGIDAVLSAARNAIVFAGAADISAISTDRAIRSVADGDNVMGLRIVATPGHTAGHIAVFDEAGGILVAGDALGTATGELAGSNPSFTEDAQAAKASVAKLGNLTFETLLVGHGEPILEGASAQVAALAAAS